MVLEKLIEGTAKLTSVQAGEIKETSEFRDRDESKMSGGLKVELEGLCH